MSVTQINKALPTLPAGWSADKDFKAVGKLSAAARRSVEPVGPYFLAHARRVRLSPAYSQKVILTQVSDSPQAYILRR